MSEKIYEKISNNYKRVSEIIKKAAIHPEIYQTFGDNEYTMLDAVPICLEFDHLKKKFPENHRKYLFPYIKKYHWLHHCYAHKFSNEDFNPKDYNTIPIIGKIIDHLYEMLNVNMELMASEIPQIHLDYDFTLEAEIPEQLKPIGTQMNKSIYEKAKDNCGIIKNIVDNLLFGDQPHDIGYTLDPLIYIAEFDQIKQEFKEYSKYLSRLLKEYEHLLGLFNYYTSTDEGEPSFLTDKSKEYQAFIHTLKKCLNEITVHLKRMLNPETEIQGTPKPIALPKEETRLTREQTALLFWYLRENSLIAPDVLTQNLATAISMLTVYQPTPMQNILKSKGTSSYKLGKDQNRLTEIDYKTVIRNMKNLLDYIEKDYEINKRNIGTI